MASALVCKPSLRFAAVVVAALTSSCVHDAPSVAPAAAPLAPSVPASPLRASAGTPAADPASAAPAEHDEDPTIEVTSDAVFFHDIKACDLPPLVEQPQGSGAACKGPNTEPNLSIQALIDVVRAHPDAPATAGSPTRILFAAKTPYRVFVEVLFTAGQLHLLHQELTVRTARGQVLAHKVAMSISKYFVPEGAPPPPGPAPTFIDTTLDPRGATLIVDKRPVGRDCRLDGAAPTVPSAPSIDFPTLARCARTLRAELPNTADETMLRASADTPTELLLEVVSTLRCGTETCLARGAKPREGTFENVLFKVPRWSEP